MVVQRTWTNADTQQDAIGESNNTSWQFQPMAKPIQNRSNCTANVQNVRMFIL